MVLQFNRVEKALKRSSLEARSGTVNEGRI
jgi:hypothetical protein